MNFQKDNFDSQNQFLCFSLGSDKYAVSLFKVKEVLAHVIIIEPIYENQPLVGIYVDGIDHVVTYKKSEMSQPLFVSSLVNSEYIVGVGRIDHDLKIILDLQKIYSCDGLELIKEAS